MTLGILLVDPQNDFYPGGALAVAGGDAINAPINELLQHCKGAPVYISRDWHPASTKHFQELGGTWPPHCVQGTDGASFHSALALPQSSTVYSKGQDPDDDAGYSAFEGVSAAGRTLREDLQRAGVEVLVVAGLATDYCVKASCLDAVKYGFTTQLFTPGVRAVNISPTDGDTAIAEMSEAGVQCIDTMPTLNAGD